MGGSAEPQPGEAPGVPPLARLEEAAAQSAIGLAPRDQVDQDIGDPRAPGDGLDQEREERGVEEPLAPPGRAGELRVDLVPEMRLVATALLDALRPEAPALFADFVVSDPGDDIPLVSQVPL